MAIGEETGNGGISGFGLEDDAAGSIRIVNRTTTDDPISTSSHVQADLDNFDSGNPLLAESAAVTIDASIGKLRRIHKMENAEASQTDGSAMCRKGDFDDENHANESVNTIEPPDGGLRAWMIMIGSFTINGVLFSIINSYSLIYQELQKRLIEAGETEVSSKAALVGSLTIGTTFFLSPIAGILTDKFGIQTTTFVGGAIASVGLLLSSLLTAKVELLFLTYGVMYGLGASLAYTPSLAILGHYFKKYLGLVNGIVTAGSSIFTTLLPSLMEVLILRLGLEGTLRSLAVLTATIMACAILFKPIPLTSQGDKSHKIKSLRNHMKEFVNVSIWKKKRYVVWAVSIPLALFGYFVPYVHIGKFVTTTFKDADSKLPVMCVGITSGIGRLIFGYIADLPKVNRIFLQQISFVSIGVLTMLLPVTKSFLMLLIISLGMGLFDGCFISLLGPIAFDICGRSGATQAIGFLLGMCSIPLTVGPPIAGLLYDHTGTYDLPFLLAGVPPIIGALTMFLIRCVKENNEGSLNDSENVPSKTDCQNARMKNSDFSPASIVEQTCESAMQEKYSTMCKSLPSSQCYCVKQLVKLQNCSACNSYQHKYANYCRYSESEPLLHREKI
ncbi:PREDICTED: monocarboxylate transporter 10 isoform X1 [Acromyrmex echinatior]|uniref:monocarboxylate transporter 10 isoform X1 n=1 Tax=Acromyrmex echinatior TaxID=103372 RepID=UPI000580DACF|nr:PREDICTED: monocarboxylate transporter 10 isoform X1 [Acromyrmex echinatior]XP_011051928.1 PREDICTED: monocarboxylate transporter 10 isoform X1 [Acromyrmex echinatior]XP_011051929.1 PREDICTED: monocarboxylate transporter 10 isoform X1 [Acromyrmex echinatior]XP_011051930.1 PREDICTED: monocarboxylate transporter 10 isoform X1 [Acromyrmex echinatior]XP_011051931.1 PREDICTED: monocarboxylate transporter 10 isoform X1 [Acromyrmex echinatior]XP_011051932.1 PREDICTED: monocarboxylate transporter 1